MQTIEDYYRLVFRLLYKSNCVVNFWQELKYEGGTEGFVRARTLQFDDGAVLQFTEDVVVTSDGNLLRPAYSYQYTRPNQEDGFYFRYDRDPDPATVERYKHEECHLHVNQQEPRYVTHATSFEEVFCMILHHFYPDAAQSEDTPCPSN